MPWRHLQDIVHTFHDMLTQSKRHRVILQFKRSEICCVLASATFLTPYYLEKIRTLGVGLAKSETGCPMHVCLTLCLMNVNVKTRRLRSIKMFNLCVFLWSFACWHWSRVYWNRLCKSCIDSPLIPCTRSSSISYYVPDVLFYLFQVGKHKAREHHSDNSFLVLLLLPARFHNFFRDIVNYAFLLRGGVLHLLFGERYRAQPFPYVRGAGGATSFGFVNSAISAIGPKMKS